jgi:hypothetical protein
MLNCLLKRYYYKYAESMKTYRVNNKDTVGGGRVRCVGVLLVLF